MSKRDQCWVCWQEPESDRGKISLIPCSWIAKSMNGDGVSAGSLVLCRWPRSEELFRANVIHDPTPTDLAQAEVMDVPGFTDDAGDGAETGAALRRALGRRERVPASPTKDDGQFVLGHLKRFFLSEMTKMGGEMQANFDILGHRIGALEVGMKCVRERVERIENLLNTAVHDLDQTERGLNLGDTQRRDEHANSRGQSTVPKRSLESARVMKSASDNEEDPQEEEIEPRAVVIPRASEQRPRKDRNPRPRAIVVTCPRDRNVVFLGGDERYRMALSTYLDAIRHAKRPTATYMVTALLRRYLPTTTLARLCVNERQLGNTKGGEMVDDELLDVLKKQGRMQFPHTSVADRELMLRIEDVARDVRRKIKLKKVGTTSSTKRSAGIGASSTPISMVTAPRATMVDVGGGKGRSRGSYATEASLMMEQDDGRMLQLKDADGMSIGENSDGYHDNPEALPMFS